MTEEDFEFIYENDLHARKELRDDFVMGHNSLSRHVIVAIGNEVRRLEMRLNRARRKYGLHELYLDVGELLTHKYPEKERD